MQARHLAAGPASPAGPAAAASRCPRRVLTSAVAAPAEVVAEAQPQPTKYTLFDAPVSNK